MQIGEEHLQHMEWLLAHAVSGTHLLFDHNSLKAVLKEVKDDRTFFSPEIMEKVQQLMTALLSKKTHLEKIAFLNDLDQDTFEILARSYFHMVEHAAYKKISNLH